MKKEQIEEVSRLSRGLVEFLQKNCCPYTAIVIDDTGIKVVSTEMFMPKKLVISQDDYEDDEGLEWWQR